MIWWLSDARRADAEFKGIEALAKEVDWISTDVAPILKDKELCCEFDIMWAGESYPLRLHYPAYFPDVPARIKHRDGQQISLHQYGQHGELCLRHRAENWTSDVTGRSMIEDAYALISGEHPEDGSKGHVPSGEALTLGQRHKKAWLRFIAPYGLELFTPADADGTAKAFKLVHSGFGDSFNVRVKAVEKDPDGNWLSITPPLPGDIENEALALKLGETKINADDSAATILSQLAAHYPDADLSSLQKEERPAYLLVEASGVMTLYALFADAEKKPAVFTTIQSPPPQDRLPETLSELREKRVAVIGCGSIGSKIAISLARVGVRDFLLLDDDIFFEDNTVRNGLDCLAVGRHKVDAVKESMERLPGSFSIDAERMGLGRQNSARSTDITLEKLAKVDLIIDATANARAFNYIAAVSARNSIPYIGCSVLAGGIGGLVLRCRPELDPTPAKARAQIKHWRKTRSEPWEDSEETDPYTYSVDEAAIIASDAEVSIVAGHATQMALDIIGSGNLSRFPYSAYAISFSDAWVFTEPFATLPIGLVKDGVWGDRDHSQDGKNAEHLASLLQRFSSEDKVE